MSKKFKFKLGNDTHEWDEQFITYEQLAAIPPGLPAGADLFIKEKHKPGRQIRPGERFDLGESGIEKFYIDDTKSGAGAR
jgi:Multiubiquitin